MSFNSPKRGLIKKLCVTLFCLTGAAAAGYYLYCDLYLVGTDGSGTTMATVKHLVATVKRKSSRSYLWALTKPGQIIFRRDSILVGPESSAALDLKDGSTLEIGENSLIVVDDLANVSLNYMRGAFIVRSKEGDRRLEADGSGKIKTQKIAARLLFPATHARQLILPEASGEGASGEILFRWEPVKKEILLSGSPIALQVSQNKFFSSLATRAYPVADGVSQFGVLLSPGKYFWRLSQDNQPITETRVIRIAKTEPLKAVWPPPGQPVEQWGDEGTVQFRWVPPQDEDAAAAVWVVVAKDLEFKDIVSREPVAAHTGRMQLVGLPEGNFYWRMVSKMGEREIPGPPQPFSVKRVSLLPLELQGESTGQAVPLPDQFRFAWNFAQDSNSPDAEFRLSVEKRQGNGYVEVFTQGGRGQSAVWKKPLSGHLRWQVVATRQGQVMGKSDWRELTFFDGKPIALKAPGQKQVIHYWEAPPPVEFSWEPANSGAGKEYVIEVASDYKFKNVVASPRAVAPPFLASELKLEPGTYFWRVRLVDSGNQTLRMSSPSSFEYGLHPLLPPPMSARPKPGIVISVLQAEGDPSLEWDSVPEATGYELNVRSPKTGAAFTEVVKETSFLLKGFSAGRYVWSVRAIDRVGRRGEEMPWRDFKLHYGPLPAPKSVVSEVQ